MYERIVVGTDGSRPALDAVARAAELAERSASRELHVVSAAHEYSTTELAEIRHDLPEEFRDLFDADAESDRRFTDAERVAAAHDVKVIRHYSLGDAATAILGVAEREGADLIVVGARGLGAVQRFLRGSVSTKIAHHSPCDVLVVEHQHV